MNNFNFGTQCRIKRAPLSANLDEDMKKAKKATLSYNRTAHNQPTDGKDSPMNNSRVLVSVRHKNTHNIPRVPAIIVTSAHHTPHNPDLLRHNLLCRPMWRNTLIATPPGPLYSLPARRTRSRMTCKTSHPICSPPGIHITAIRARHVVPVPIHLSRPRQKHDRMKRNTRRFSECERTCTSDSSDIGWYEPRGDVMFEGEDDLVDGVHC